jgi:hypothetical protein
VQRRAAERLLGDAFVDPPHERDGLARVTQAHQREEREAGVADPRVAVVPVAHAAGRFGQPERRCRHDRAVLTALVELQDERGAAHDLAPSTAVGRVAHPGAPERHRRVEGPRGEGLDVELGGRRVALEDERRRFAAAYDEARDHVVAVDLQRDAAAQAERLHARSPERDGVVVDADHVVRGPAVVEARGTPQAEGDVAPDRACHANDALHAFVEVHPVEDLRDPSVGEAVREQDVRVGQVELLLTTIVLGDELEGAAAVGVEE